MNRSTLSLLLITFFIGSVYCVDCTKFKDGDKCVDRCTPPLVGNKKTLTCIKLEECVPANNVNVYVDQNNNECVDKCPDNFEGRTRDGGKVLFCVPCFFKDAQNTCYEECPAPRISNEPKKNCIEKPQDCLNIFVKDLSRCVEKCPFKFSESTDQAGMKICVPCSTCTDPNTCKGKLSADKQQCSKNCPAQEIALDPVQGQPFIQCQKCPDDKKFVSMNGKTCLTACESKQLMDKNSNRCIDSSQCKFVITENSVQYCVPQCPPGQAPSQVNGQTYLSCAACEANKVFDPITKACADSCTIKATLPDKSIKCLKDLMECQGFVSGKECVSECDAASFIRQNEKGFIECIVKCDDTEFQFTDDKKRNVCGKTCPPGLTGDSTTKKCNPLSTCKGVLSSDGQKCLEQCPPGQFAQQGAPCKPCQGAQGKISSDGKSCNKECASTELFDVELVMCIAADKCTKIKNDTDKVCSERCKEGQIQTGEGKDRKCLGSMNDCQSPKFISADGRRCLDSCEEGQIQVASGDKSKFCRPCPYGKENDTTCKKQDACQTIFDIDTNSCVQRCGANKFLQGKDNKICSSKCIPPYVKKEGDTANCILSDSCTGDYVLSKEGCSLKSTCTGAQSSKISSDGKKCVKNCMDIMEAEVSGNCVKCSDTQIPLVSGGKISCSDKSSNTSSDAKIRANSLKDAMKDVVELTINQQGQMRDEIKNLAKDMETGIKDTKKSTQVSKEEQGKAIKQMLDSLKDVASNFLSKITSDSSKPSTNPDENKLSLLSEEFNLIAEKKKFGCAFVTKFNANDFNSSTKAPELQVDSSTLDPTTSANTNTSFDSVQVTNVQTNPYCTNADNCGLSGFFQVKATTATRRMLVDSNSSQTFSSVYTVEASKIAKTVCMSRDANELLVLAVSTVIDKATNKVTCTYKENIFLYLDTTCKYIDPTICTTTNNTNNNNNQDGDVTFSSNLLISLAISIIYLLI